MGQYSRGWNLLRTSWSKRTSWNTWYRWASSESVRNTWNTWKDVCWLAGNHYLVWSPFQFFSSTRYKKIILGITEKMTPFTLQTRGIKNQWKIYFSFLNFFFSFEVFYFLFGLGFSTFYLVWGVSTFYLVLGFWGFNIYSSSSKTGSATLSSMRSSAGK
jgi:hypothetical protein